MKRRSFLQVGGSSLLGIGLPQALGASRSHAREIEGRRVGEMTTSELPFAAERAHRVKSVVLVFLTGGASHIDTFDPKPDAIDTRGEFGTIGTKIPGIRFTEHLPGLAHRADRLAIIRSMAHRDNRHLSGTHNTLTGSVQPFRGNANEDKELHRGDWPCYGGGVNRFGTASPDAPSQVTLPHPLIEGPLTWPGQHAGFLGPAYDPLVLRDDPNQDEFRVKGLALADGVSISRMDSRRALLGELNRHRRQLDTLADVGSFTRFQEAAYSVLTSPKLSRAFDLASEPPGARDRFGRNMLGQTLLLARRLVEVEVPVIQCNMGIVQTWDTHSDNFPRLKDRLLPQLDQGVSALLDDLSDRGRLGQTLVVMVGEFGRTPRISTLPGAATVGRDHWAWAYSAVFAGGGVVPGKVIGKTDRIGAYPVTTPYHPNDLGATIYRALGVDPATTVYDQFRRPLPLNRGTPIDALYG